MTASVRSLRALLPITADEVLPCVARHRRDLGFPTRTAQGIPSASHSLNADSLAPMRDACVGSTHHGPSAAVSQRHGAHRGRGHPVARAVAIEDGVIVALDDEALDYGVARRIRVRPRRWLPRARLPRRPRTSAVGRHRARASPTRRRAHDGRGRRARARLRATPIPSSSGSRAGATTRPSCRRVSATRRCSTLRSRTGPWCSRRATITRCGSTPRRSDRAGIDASTPDPELGRIIRHGDGTPVGTLVEWGAIAMVRELLPVPGPSEQEAALAGDGRARAIGHHLGAGSGEPSVRGEGLRSPRSPR